MFGKIDMYPVLFEVFGRQIGTYGLFMVLGAVAAWVVVRLLLGRGDKVNDKNRINNKDIPLIFLICICGGLIGLFLLRPIMRIPEYVANWELLRQLPFEVLILYIFGEAVFYGGLIGGAIAMFLFCRGFKIPMLPVLDLFAPALAVAHGFGRIGCFFAGCCYGVPVQASNPIAVVFPPSAIGAPTGVPLFPMQLVEAACLFVLAAVLVVAYKKTAGTGLTICLYGLLYSVLRFVLEFYRGDAGRGVYGLFSTSQYISIGLFVVSAVLFCFVVKKRRCIDNSD